MTSDHMAADSGSQIAAEVDRICASMEFARAPVMRRLLRFLADQTLAGQGDALKAYGVAVDGLGRSADFDPQTDSYPRVQVGRLRKMVDRFYEGHGTGPDGRRLSIPIGSYRVHMDDAEPALAAPPAPEATVAGTARRTGPRSRQRILLLAILLLAVLSLAVGWWLWTRGDPPPARPEAWGYPPTIEIQTIQTVEQADPLMAERIKRVLDDALHRSWILNVHDPALPSADGDGGADYRLSGTLVGNVRKLLYLNLWDIESGTQIWSDRIELKGHEHAVRPALSPTIAGLLSPYGVIGSRERRRLAGIYAPGFPCMLQYGGYYTRGDEKQEARVWACLTETLRLQPGYAPATAARIAILNRYALRNPERGEAIRRRSLTMAQDAVARDPYSFDAQMALARASYFAGLCERGRVTALRGLELNPYDASSQAVTGVSMFQCGDPEYEHHLGEARRLDPSLPAFVSLPIIIQMADRGEEREALKLARSLPIGEGRWRPSYDLTMAVAKAGTGDIEGARAHWRNAARQTGAGNDRPADVLSRIIMAPPLADRVEAVLRQKGVLPPAAPGTASSPAAAR